MTKSIFLSVFLVGFLYYLPFIEMPSDLEPIILTPIKDFSIETLSTTDVELKENIEIIPVSIDGVTVDMEINDYLIGVLAAEMPALFENEALKAQSVAARTFIYYRKDLIEKGLDDNVHEGAIVCNDPNHCKAYIDLDNLNPWGDDYLTYLNKLENAVYDTDSEYIVYDDEPIAAVFHSTSSGYTETAKDVFGGEIPYLTSVLSDEKYSSPHYESKVYVLFDTFKKMILAENPDASFDSAPTEWFKNSTRSEAGGIINVYVGGVLIDGLDLRFMFNLNSTNFTVSFDDKNVIFTTYGYGHGVGLSQYGANELAKDGKTYDEILSWYYKNTELKK